jgi:hypothetical protein
LGFKKKKQQHNPTSPELVFFIKSTNKTSPKLVKKHKQNLTHQSWFKTSTINTLSEFCLSKAHKKNTNQPLQNLGMVPIKVNSCAINRNWPEKS